MSRYSTLATLLDQQPSDTWRVTFFELERLMNVSLPASARKYPAWWSNDPSNNPMTRIWLSAGWRSEQVDVPGETLVFRRVASPEQIKGFGDRPRDFAGGTKLEYKALGLSGSARAYEAKSAATEGAGGSMTGGLSDDTHDPPSADWLEALEEFVQQTVTLAPEFDPAAPAMTDEEWAAAEKDMEAEWSALYGPLIDAASGQQKKSTS